MTVESVNYISDLEPARPQGGDSIAQGDDHIRNIKKALKQTFPNVDGEVRASDEEMNHLVGVTEPIIDIISGGESDMAALEARVAKNETDIAANTTGVADNTQGISDLQEALAALQDQVDNLPSGGSMIKAVQQPATAGDFTARGMEATYSAPVQVGSSISKKLVVPDGMVFCFEYLFGVGGGTLRIDIDEVYIDGVKLYGTNQGSFDYDSNGGPVWPGNDKSSIIRVEESLEIRGMSCYNDESDVFLAGMFTEA